METVNVVLVPAYVCFGETAGNTLIWHADPE
jgi:hypothetical protein